MSEPLRWQRNASTLSLSDMLDRDTLLALWHERETAMVDVATIDVGALDRAGTR